MLSSNQSSVSCVSCVCVCVWSLYSRCGWSPQLWLCTGPSPTCPGWSSPCGGSQPWRSCSRSASPGLWRSPTPGCKHRVNNKKNKKTKTCFSILPRVSWWGFYLISNDISPRPPRWSWRQAAARWRRCTAGTSAGPACHRHTHTHTLGYLGEK